MKENSESSKNTSDEMDLLELFAQVGRAIGNFLVMIVRFILGSFSFLLKKWLILGLCVIIGILLSFLTTKIIKPYYSSDFVLRTNTISCAEIISYVNRLSFLCKENNNRALTEALKISEDSVAYIKNLEAFYVIDINSDEGPDYIDFKNKHDIYDTVNVRMEDRFAVRIKSFSPDLFSTIRDGVITYIESNEILARQNELRLSQIDETIERLQYDIEQLDSLQGVKYFEETRNNIPEEGGQMVFIQEQRTQLLYQDIYSLFRQEQELNLEKDLYPGVVSLLTDYIPVNDNVNGTLYYGKYIIPIILVLTVLVLIILEYRSGIDRFIRKV